jgi:hypothetical protein
MIYIGDFKEDSAVYFCWTTNDKNGASAAPSAAGTIRVYKDDGTTEIVAPTGITDTRAFDSLTGVHNCRIDLSANDFYAPGHDYSVVLVGATIDGQTVNANLAAFSIENRWAGSLLFKKAAKVLTSKAVQNKLTGAINYYDDDGQTIILTHTAEENESALTRTPS